MTRNPNPNWKRTRPYPTLMFIGALVVASVVLLVALEEEPYYIDELRQTRSYTLPLDQVVERSFAQDQPPLDPILNSIVQTAIGEGDWQQRFLSALFALAGFTAFGVMTWRAGFQRGAPFGVLVLALSPTLVSVFVYARPYALPFFLIMTFLLSADFWLREGRKAALPFLFIAGVLLPLSRTIEPNIALGAVVLVLVALRRGGRANEFLGTVWVPVGASLLGLAAVGLPVVVHLRVQLTGYAQGGFIPSGEQVARLVTELPEVLAASVPAWPAALIVVVAILASKPTRKALMQTWWAWVLLVIPVTFVLLFLLTTNPSQPLFERYMFTWIPLLALAVSAVVSDVKLGQPRRLVVLLGAVATMIFIGASTIQLVSDLFSNEREDWDALSTTIEKETEDDWIVVLEHLRLLGVYRSPFAGIPRYLSRDREAPAAHDIIKQPGLIGTNRPIAIALWGPTLTIPGWERISVDEFFSLYIPNSPVAGPIEAADALLLFSNAVDADRGATLALAGASLYLANEHETEACAVITDLRAEPGLTERVDDALSGGAVVDWRTYCATDG